MKPSTFNLDARRLIALSTVFCVLALGAAAQSTKIQGAKACDYYVRATFVSGNCTTPGTVDPSPTCVLVPANTSVILTSSGASYTFLRKLEAWCAPTMCTGTLDMEWTCTPNMISGFCCNGIEQVIQGSPENGFQIIAR